MCQGSHPTLTGTRPRSWHTGLEKDPPPQEANPLLDSPIPCHDQAVCWFGKNDHALRDLIVRQQASAIVMRSVWAIAPESCLLYGRVFWVVQYARLKVFAAWSRSCFLHTRDVETWRALQSLDLPRCSPEHFIKSSSR